LQSRPCFIATSDRYKRLAGTHELTCLDQQNDPDVVPECDALVRMPRGEDSVAQLREVVGDGSVARGGDQARMASGDNGRPVLESVH
jgi:hypothetical protein